MTSDRRTGRTTRELERALGEARAGKRVTFFTPTTIMAGYCAQIVRELTDGEPWKVHNRLAFVHGQGGSLTLCRLDPHELDRYRGADLRPFFDHTCLEQSFELFRAVLELEAYASFSALKAQRVARE